VVPVPARRRRLYNPVVLHEKMKIPHTHYVYFWLVNSGMALGAGFLIWYGLIGIMSMAGVPFLAINLIPLLVVLWQQVILMSFFAGKRRGAFEYSYLEKITEHSYGNTELRNRLEDAKREFKLGDPRSGNEKLRETAKKHSDNFVVQFKYATSCEKIGLGKDALESYRKALLLLDNSSSALLSYVRNQIVRVEKYGPSRKSSNPGLQYVLY